MHKHIPIYNLHEQDYHKVHLVDPLTIVFEKAENELTQISQSIREAAFSETFIDVISQLKTDSLTLKNSFVPLLDSSNTTNDLYDNVIKVITSWYKKYHKVLLVANSYTMKKNNHPQNDTTKTDSNSINEMPIRELAYEISSVVYTHDIEIAEVNAKLSMIFRENIKLIEDEESKTGYDHKWSWPEKLEFIFKIHKGESLNLRSITSELYKYDSSLSKANGSERLLSSTVSSILNYYIKKDIFYREKKSDNSPYYYGLCELKDESKSKKVKSG